MVRTIDDVERIAAQFFNPEEAVELMGLPEPDRLQGFFNCWTRREACMKAAGDGLSVPSTLFRVNLRPGEPARLLSLDGRRPAIDWTLHHFVPSLNSVGAIAYLDKPRPLLHHFIQSGELLG